MLNRIIMKKLIGILSLICYCSFLDAQVKLEICSYQELLEKAKQENKLALVVGSTTWCGPCKILYDKIFPLKDVGEFMNSKFVIRRYELDKECPPEIKSLNITGYPTFVILDTAGNEISRFCGIEFEPEKFKLQIEDALKKENAWNVRLLRFRQDPSYAKEHILYLMSLKRFADADTAVCSTFSKRSPNENFSEEFLGIYRRLINEYCMLTLHMLIDNKDMAIKVMGNDNYMNYMSAIGRDLIFNNGKFADLKEILPIIKKYPILKTSIANFAERAQKAIALNRISDMLRIASDMIVQLTSNERYCIVCYISDHMSTLQEKKEYADFLERILAIETDENLIASLKGRLTMINKELEH